MLASEFMALASKSFRGSVHSFSIDNLIAFNQSSIPLLHLRSNLTEHITLQKFIHPSIRSSICPSVRPSVHPSIHPYTINIIYGNINMHAYTHSYIQPCMHTYMHACICTYMHTHTHAK